MLTFIVTCLPKIGKWVTCGDRNGKEFAVRAGLLLV